MHLGLDLLGLGLGACGGRLRGRQGAGRVSRSGAGGAGAQLLHTACSGADCWRPAPAGSASQAAGRRVPAPAAPPAPAAAARCAPCPRRCSPSRKPFLNLRGRSFRLLMRPVPVVRLRMAFWPHWSTRGQGGGREGGRSRELPGACVAIGQADGNTPRFPARAGCVDSARPTAAPNARRCAAPLASAAPWPACSRAGCDGAAAAACQRQPIAAGHAGSSGVSGVPLTGPLPGSRVAARGAGALLDVEAPLAAATAQRVRLVAALTCGAAGTDQRPRRRRPGPPHDPAARGGRMASLMPALRRGRPGCSARRGHGAAAACRWCSDDAPLARWAAQGAPKPARSRRGPTEATGTLALLAHCCCFCEGQAVSLRRARTGARPVL